MQMNERILILGIGNTIRGDDIIGLLLVEALQEEGLTGVTIKGIETAGFEILDEMAGYDRVIILDAMRTERESEIGAIVVSRLEEKRPTVTLLPSHGFDFAGLIKAYRHAQPGKFPEDIRFILVKVKEVDEFREGMSEGLEKKFETIVEKVRKEIGKILNPPPR